MRDAAFNCVAVGFFDGVHIGHRRILEGADVALTFGNHPMSVLAPDKAPRLVMSVDDRLAAIRACGVKETIVLEFTPELAATSPVDFMARLPAGKVRCGENWRFGRAGEGNAEFLRSHGFEVEVVPYAEYQGERVSSTRIRAELAAGRIASAAAMLGRGYSIAGEIVAGKGIGRTQGFPTVNIRPAFAAAIPFGAYVVEVGGKRAIANYGLAPTAGVAAWTDPMLEVHFPDGLPAEFGGRVRVTLAEYLRPERRFASYDELKRQIGDDLARAGFSGGRTWRA